MDDIVSLDQVVKGIEPIDEAWVETARERTAQLVMPTRALGMLHDISERLCGILQTLEPEVKSKAVLIMAGDHGVVTRGVSAYPQEVTGAMIQTFLAGGAGINAIAGHVGAQVWVADMGAVADIDPSGLPNAERLLLSKVGKGTADITQGPAMSLEDAQKTIMIGFQHASRLFGSGLQLLGTGDMGIGNTTASAAIGAAVTGMGVDQMVGRGTGVDDKGLERKKAAVRQALELNKPDGDDALDVLSKVGGFEIGAIAGSILAAAYHRRPVVVDGFISTAGALIAAGLCPHAVQYMFAGHCSAEAGHENMLKFLKLEPILRLGMRLGEGTGAALAMSVVEAAVKMFRQVMTFAEAGVADKE